MLEAIHGLLRPTWMEFMTLLDLRRRHVAESDEGIAAPETADDLCEDADRPAGTCGEQSGEGPQPPSAADNARYRAKATELVNSRPLGILTLLRLIMEPLRVLLDNKLFQASHKWEQAQQARAAAHLIENSEGPVSFQSREYRLLMAAETSWNRNYSSSSNSCKVLACGC